ncbi:hypothetical protein JKP88DRAFT_244956 [Tribonema minus]|uniref:Uncharacterized protein n=1 Tax=Tribonema minus TaxID=303371 RepID=A0A835Z2Z3_9STRA|nr:hypothetical protein JKP88DRAFT_244956 [Tribonema minus]
MGAGPSCRGNNYEAFVSALRQSRCIAGPHTAVGMIDPTHKFPPVVLFGEWHKAANVGKGCELLSSVLQKTLSCDNTCAEQVHIFLEANVQHTEELGFGDMSIGQLVKSGGKVSTDLAHAIRIAWEWVPKCGSQLHMADPFYRQRLVHYTGMSLLDMKDSLCISAATIIDYFDLPLRIVVPDTSSIEECFDKLIEVCRAALELYPPPISKHALMYADHLDAMAKMWGSGEGYLTVMNALFTMLTDVNAVWGMISAEKSSLNIGYWGATHVRGQAEFLRACGYFTMFEWANNGEDGTGFFETGVSATRQRERRFSEVPRPTSAEPALTYMEKLVPGYTELQHAREEEKRANDEYTAALSKLQP